MFVVAVLCASTVAASKTSGIAARGRAVARMDGPAGPRAARSLRHALVRSSCAAPPIFGCLLVPYRPLTRITHHKLLRAQLPREALRLERVLVDAPLDKHRAVAPRLAHGARPAQLEVAGR